MAFPSTRPTLSHQTSAVVTALCLARQRRPGVRVTLSATQRVEVEAARDALNQILAEAENIVAKIYADRRAGTEAGQMERNR